MPSFLLIPSGRYYVDKTNCPEMKIRCPKADGYVNPQETMTPRVDSSPIRASR
jgi:hypothetical protein